MELDLLWDWLIDTARRNSVALLSGVIGVAAGEFFFRLLRYRTYANKLVKSLLQASEDLEQTRNDRHNLIEENKKLVKQFNGEKEATAGLIKRCEAWRESYERVEAENRSVIDKGNYLADTLGRALATADEVVKREKEIEEQPSKERMTYWRKQLDRRQREEPYTAEDFVEEFLAVSAPSEVRPPHGGGGTSTLGAAATNKLREKAKSLREEQR